MPGALSVTASKAVSIPPDNRRRALRWRNKSDGKRVWVSTSADVAENSGSYYEPGQGETIIGNAQDAGDELFFRCGGTDTTTIYWG